MSWFHHAFAVDPPGPAEPTPEQREPLEWLCREVVRRHLTTPTLLALEMARPLNYLGAQLLHALGPGVSALLAQRSYQSYQQVSLFLEQRGSIDWLCARIEQLEAEAERKEREGARGAAETQGATAPNKEDTSER